jgi:hypothetical protein
MVEVPLGKRAYARKGVALVDDEDVLHVQAHNWFINNGYAATYIDGALVGMHNLIMGALWVDHRNNNRLDNQRANLRPCSPSQNAMNRSPRTGTSSQYKGVHWEKDRQRWVARIKVNGVYKNLGRFTDEMEAAQAYDRAAITHYGEFAHPNMRESE